MAFTIPNNIFRQYDIRGLYGSELTEDIANSLGRAFAAYLFKTSGKKTARVSIARDVRNSSTAIRDALVSGLTSAGVDCVDLGECPSPLSYYSVNTMELSGGIMITGSHNPPEYNGFKLSVGKDTIHGQDIQGLRVIMQAESKHILPTGEKKGVVSEKDIISPYVAELTEKFSHLNGGGSKKVKIVLDSGNGTAGPVAPALLSAIGAEVVELFSEPDGNFPNHHPDPTIPENLTHLIDKVKEEGADFGVAYDGDADRIGVVSETGEIVWGDELMVIFSRDILKNSPGATIVGEVKCSQTLYDDILASGGEPVMWKTGHSIIKSKMKELGAAMAGEMSGHIFFADRYYGFDDAIYATCRLYEILSGKKKAVPGYKFSDLLKGLPKTFSTPEIRVDCPDTEKFSIVKKLGDTIAEGTEGVVVKDVVTIDGLRVIVDGGWALIRASNTQPALVMRFEAESEGLLDCLKAFMKERLEGASSQVKVPW